MKCTDKKFIRRFSAGLACVLCVSILTGCSDMKNVSDAYDAIETSALYHLTTGISSGQTALFASDLCIGGEENTTDTQGVDVSAFTAAGLFDLSSQTILFSNNIYKKVYPASTTKILTAYLAIKYGDLDDEITVSSKAAAVPEGSSVCGLQAGDVLTLREALYGLLLTSGNDAANAIAEYISGSISDFTALMNEEAKALGATQSHFVNAHGYPDDSHYTTVYDLYLITNAAIGYSEFTDIIATKDITVTYRDADKNEVSVVWENTNQYLNGTTDPPANVTVIGGKTGSADSSGYCLVLYSKNSEGDPQISIVMKSESKNELYASMSDVLTDFSN